MSNSFLKAICAISIATGLSGIVAAENAQPTRGRIPDDAFGEEGLDIDIVPDYIAAYSRSGVIAGYVRKTDVFTETGVPKARVVVVDESLSRVVGHMVTERGFVPLGKSDGEVPKFETNEFSDTGLEEGAP